ncbi:hypothetical protein FGG08_005637 [Glutinoglossum americanum]|uniref:Uncharacterized protein n=1 Tax=Glutinoglossum americanum TaxID=1670608 RepID=A0A9P8L1M7_9PEZI|nr:hypothetical protein FGG08_005637 [Glutinoglossum americanum]
MDKDFCMWYCCQCHIILSLALEPACTSCNHHLCGSCIVEKYDGPTRGPVAISQGHVPGSHHDQLPSSTPPTASQPHSQGQHPHVVAPDFRRYHNGDPPRHSAQGVRLRLSVYDRLLADRNDFPSVWEYQIVPFIVAFLPAWLKSPQGEQLDESYSVDVFNSAKPGASSPTHRVIHITAAQSKSLAWRILVAGSIIERLPDRHKDTQFLFVLGCVERSISDAHGVSEERPDYIFPPERPHFEKCPSMGASIGVEGGDSAGSATFGGRVLLQDVHGRYVECFLTCSHLFENAEDGVVITQPSPEEAVLLNERIKELNNLITDGHVTRPHHILALKRELRECTEILETFPDERAEMRLGYLLRSSGFRAIDRRLSSEEPEVLDNLSMMGGPTAPPSEMKAQVEMDWAIGVIYSSRSGDNRLPSAEQWFPIRSTRDRGNTSTCEGRSTIFCEEVREFKPGAEVYSIGRTSGLQRGRISETPSVVKINGRPDDCYNREWVVLQHEGDKHDEADWVSHGMGTPGDSGSWLLGMDNALYGMIWGRNKAFGEGPRKAIFTPILDVFDDIAEMLGCDPPVLPRPVSAATVSQAQEHDEGIANLSTAHLLGDGCVPMEYISPEYITNRGASVNPSNAIPNSGDNDDMETWPEDSSPGQIGKEFDAMSTASVTSSSADLDAVLEASTSYFEDAWPSSTRPRKNGQPLPRTGGLSGEHRREHIVKLGINMAYRIKTR